MSQVDGQVHPGCAAAPASGAPKNIPQKAAVLSGDRPLIQWMMIRLGTVLPGALWYIAVSRGPFTRESLERER